MWKNALLMNDTMDDIRVLVVEDDLLQNRLLTSFVESLGHQAVSATDGTSALCAFQETLPDVIFLDYELPDTTGHALVSQFRERAKRWLPIIFLSAHDAVDIQRQCLIAGGDDFISKPLDYTILEAKVTAMVRIARLQRQIQNQNEALSLHVARVKEENVAAQYLYDRLIRSTNDIPDFVQQRVIPAEGFSGDLLAHNEGPNGHHYWLLADATGHGLTAAISLIPITQVFYAMSQKGHHLGAVVNEMHRQLKRYTPAHRFVCAIVIELDPVHRSLSIWNGGMPDVFVMDGVGRMQHRLFSKHLPLGLQRSGGFDNTIDHCTYLAGARLFACSDGLVEATNALDEAFGDKRVEALFVRQPSASIDSIEQELVAFLDETPAQDDIALLLVNLPEPKYLTVESPSHLTPTPRHACEWALSLSGAQLQFIDPVPMAGAWLNNMCIEGPSLAAAHVIIQELISNAIDHGLLEISSAIKEGQDGFSRYLAVRHDRLNALQQGILEISLGVCLKEDHWQLRIHVKDSGKGYTLPVTQLVSDPRKKHGRGLNLVYSLSTHVELFPPGNETLAILRL